MRHHPILTCAAILVAAAPVVPAFAADPGMAGQIKELKVSRLGDTELSCAALENEAMAMRSIIHAKQEIEDDSELKTRGIGAVGAVGSLLIGTLTAGVGLAAAGLLATEAVDEEADRADNLKEIAAQRRSLMVGIYHAKGCEGSIDHVMEPRKQKKRPHATAMAALEEPRTAAPIAASITPASGGTSTEFRFND